MDEGLELESRRKIYRYIESHPGAHMREVQKAVGMEIGETSYHLNYLEKRELVRSTEDGYRKCFFVKEIQFKDRTLLTVARQEILRNLIMHVLLNQGISFKSMVEKFGMSKSTMSFHLKRLRETGFIREEKKERESIYFVVDPEEMARILITYKSSFADSAVDRFVDTWLQL